MHVQNMTTEKKRNKKKHSLHIELKQLIQMEQLVSERLTSIGIMGVHLSAPETHQNLWQNNNEGLKGNVKTPQKS